MQPAAEASPSLASGARATLWIFAGLAGAALGITILFLGMRAVMEIGGACASGGPFVPARPCPKGVPGLMVGGIWGGLAATGVYVFQTMKHRVPGVAALLWPALFLSLGWNFLEYGVAPPFGEGLAWGWLVCGIVFVAMGGLPLLVVAGPLWRALTTHGETPRIRSGLPTPTTLRAAVAGRPGPGADGSQRRWYWAVVQLTAAAAGIWVGIRLFEAVTT